MKTTLELDDSLLSEAKSVAAQRRTTLKALVEHALRRELLSVNDGSNPDPEKFEIGPLGLPVLKRRPSDPPVTSDSIRRFRDEIAQEEFQHALKLRGT